MGLLDKLEQVEIKSDSRLPEDDLMFCETQQQAYDESRRAFREIRRYAQAAKLSICSLCWNAQTRKTQSF